MVRKETAEYFEIPIGSVTDADIQVVLDNYAADWPMANPLGRAVL